jgi:hypothetical protein
MRITLKQVSMIAVLLGGSITPMVSPAWSQGQAPLNPALNKISSEPYVIRAQVTLGAQLVDQAIATLETADDPEELEKAKELVQKSYVMLRYAAGGCEMRRQSATVVENRLLAMALDNINAARERQRSAGNAIANSIPWLESRAQYMSEALELLRPVPALAQRAAPLIR